MKAITAMACCLALGLFSLSATANTFRCGTQLVSIGDRAFMVQRKCGEPVAREAVGYTVGEYNQRELPIEESVYGPRGGMLYFLRFVGNRLVSIDGQRN